MGEPQSIKAPLQVALGALLMAASLYLLFVARVAVLTSLIGVGVGIVISPILAALRRRFRVPRALSALLLVLLFSAVLAAAGYGLYVLVADQAKTLSTQAPELLKRLQEQLTAMLRRFPWLAQQLGELDLGASAQGVAGQLMKGLSVSLSTVSGFLFAVIIGLYTAVGEREYLEGVLEAVPPSRRARAATFLGDSATALRHWFKAQLLDMAIVGALTAVGLGLAGVQYWAVIAVLTALFSIIPYVGIFLMVGLAALITVASDASKLPWLLGVFFVTQQIEGNLILPLVMKGQAELPEVPLLIFMLLLGTWLGLLGVFLAPALFAVGRVAYRSFYLPAIADG